MRVSMISFESKGDFKNIEKFLKTMKRGDLFKTLDSAGQKGVSALSSATPALTGATASGWSYKTEIARDHASIIWTNSVVVAGKPLVILLQYGHGTGTGGYVRGRDFINPAMKPIFDEIANDVWKAVQTA